MALETELAVLHPSDCSFVNGLKHIFEIFLVFNQNYSPEAM